MRTLLSAQTAYKLANGNYARDVNSLDVVIPGTDSTYSGFPRRRTKFFSYGVKGNAEIVVVQRLPEDTQYVLIVWPGDVMICRGHSNIGKRVCAGLDKERIADGLSESWRIN